MTETSSPNKDSNDSSSATPNNRNSTPIDNSSASENITQTSVDNTLETSQNNLPKVPRWQQSGSHSSSKNSHAAGGEGSSGSVDDDPIVAPGYGRVSDLQRLTEALNRGSAVQLPYSAVEALMKARGRGLRRAGGAADGEAPSSPTATTGTNSTTTAATPISSAWADFMKEEGVTLGGGGATATTTTTTSSSSNRNAAAAAGVVQDREYLPLPWEKKTAARPAKKAKSDKKNSNDEQEEGGYLVQSGTLDFTIVGRGKLSAADFEQHAYHLALPTRLVMPSAVQITKVFSAGHAVHALCLDTTGQVYGWGRNEHQQLGNALPTNVYWPTLVPDAPSNVVQVATGKSHTLYLTDEGQVYATGSNKFGQCGVKPGPASETIGSPRITAVPEGVTMAEIACGEDFSMAISTEGYLYSTGCSQYGQLGNGETGEYFVTANKLAFTNCAVWTRRSTFCDGPEDKIVPLSESVLVRHVACGKHHTLVVEAAASNAKARIFSFGCGDYGCLGHGVQKDEYFPRNIAGFAHAALGDDDSQVRVAAGNSCSLLQTSTGHVYYWGKHRSVGEAVMRPQLNDVLANNQHVVQHLAAGSQTIVCATAHGQTVASGQGPHGELGLKSGAKSSAKITFVDDLNGCQVQSLAASYGSLLYVVRAGSSSDETKAVNDLAKLEKMDVMELMDRADAPPAEKGKKGRKRKA